MDTADNWEMLILEWKNACTDKDRSCILSKLQALINHLLLHDVNSLLSILYRVDVDEKKLKELLRDEPDRDAAVLLSEMIVERLIQKEISRELNRRENDIPDEDRW